MILRDDNVREAYDFIDKADKEEMRLLFYKDNDHCIMEELLEDDINSLKPEQYVLYRENMNSRHWFLSELLSVLEDIEAPKKLLESVQDNAFCSKCNRPLISGDKKCPHCGGQNIVFGKHLIVKDNDLICDCGCNTAKNCSHTSFIGYGVTNYKCTNCGAISGIEGHYEDECMY